jgi:hypothetical protein
MKPKNPFISQYEKEKYPRGKVLIVESNCLLFAYSTNHYAYKNPKLFSLSSNDMIKRDLISINFDSMLKREEWYE